MNILFSDFTPEYDPFQNYADSLPEWTEEDGDFIAELAATVTVPEQSKERWNEWLKKWLVATIGCAIDANTTNQTALIFTGAQSKGKTSWIRRLVPDTLHNYFYSGAINPTNKDSIVHCAECFIINMDEMGSFVEYKADDFKELMTKDRIRMRRPYHRQVENMPRRASFAGSSNKPQFLHDDTGSRRFLIFETLDIQYDHEIDMDYVWAQALALFKSGFSRILLQ